MAEVLAEFAGSVSDDDGLEYRAQAVGTARPNGQWEGWIEFVPLGGGAPCRTPRETTQPNHQDAVYWATGLSDVYLAGALVRAMKPVVRHVRATPEPIFDEPAPARIREMDAPVANAVLDPFEVYGNGEVMLRRKLGALAPWHLSNIIVAYQLSDTPASTLAALPAPALIEIIAGAVRERAVRR